MRPLALVLVALLAGCAESGDGGSAGPPAPTDTSTDISTDISADTLTVPDDAAPGGDAGETAGADGPEEDAAIPGPPFCDGATAHRFDPAATELEFFPHDLYTRDDPASPTGLTVEVTPENAPWVAGISELVRQNLYELTGLSGFGRNAGIVVRFTGPVEPIPTGPEASVASDAVMLLDLSTDPPERVPFETLPQDDGAAFVAWPLRPLRAGALHAFVVTTDLHDAAGGCIAPAPLTRTLLAGSPADPKLARLRARHDRVLAALGRPPEAISAMAVFTTHAELGRMAAVAADVRSRAYAWDAPATCAPQGELVACSGRFVAHDYRTDRIITGTTPTGDWTLDVSIWLPQGPGPFPTVVFAHGINSSRGEGHALAKRVAPLGFAVVATDAVQHGDHPTAEGDASDDALRFLGVDLAAFRMDLRAFRGNFNQSVVDRLQLIELLKAAPDVDDDGSQDLDPARLTYMGISLGGMMGSPTLALSPDLQAGALAVAGGWLARFATDNDRFEPFAPIVVDLIGSRALFDRILAVGQSVVDPADPATYGAHVLRERLEGAGDVPSVLFYVALNDVVVPASAGRALARALGIPHLAPVAAPVALLGVETGPLSGNVAGGAATAAYFQLDRVGGAEGPVVPADHGNVPLGPEGWHQLRRFLETWRDDPVPTIVDPYTELGTAPLP